MQRKRPTDLARLWLQSMAATYAWAAPDGVRGHHHSGNSSADLGPANRLWLLMLAQLRRFIEKAGTAIEYGVVALGILLAIITVVDQLGAILPK